MRILQINSFYGIHDTGKYTDELARALERMGHESYIAYSRGKASEARSYQIGSRIGNLLHALGSRIFGLQAYFSEVATVSLIKYIDHIRPDIVHLRNLHTDYIHLNRLLDYLSEKKITTVITLHDCWFYTGRCTHYTICECNQWQVGCFRCPGRSKIIPSWFFDRSKKMWVDKKERFLKLDRLAVVGDSDWITEEARKSFLKKANLITRVYPWIDLKIFRPMDCSGLRKSMDLTNKFVILGITDNWKGTNELNCFIHLSEQLPADCRILLIGRRDRKHSLPENMLTVPNIKENKKLAAYYSMSDVLVSLTKEETFARTAAEAMACATPVISYRSYPCAELIGENCGYIAQNHDLNDILRGILEIKKKQKGFYSVSCRNHACKQFNLNQLAGEYEEIYKALLVSNIDRMEEHQQKDISIFIPPGT